MSGGLATLLTCAAFLAGRGWQWLRDARTAMDTNGKARNKR